MDKQDELAAVIAKANDEFQAANAAFSIPYEVRRAGAIKAIAAAVRSFMGSEEAVDRACAAGADFNGFAWPDDYDGHQREMIRATNRAAISAAIGEDIGGRRG